MTLVELMVSMVVLMVAAGATMASLTSFSGLSESNEETIQAWSGLHSMVEEIHGVEFSEIFAMFDEDPNNDPAGVGTAPGSGFAIEGLDPLRTDADGFVGQIQFPVSGVTPGELYEDYQDASMGMPRDLSGDGTIDALDHADDYAVLPVRLTVNWRSRSGNRQAELEVLLLR